MINSLKLRLALLLLLPVTLLLIITGITGFIYARNLLIDQWRQGAILGLERAAHHIDMRLDYPARWINVFNEMVADNGRRANVNFILETLETLEGVTRVDLTWFNDQVLPGEARENRLPMPMNQDHRMHRHKAEALIVTGPRYDAEIGEETVVMVSEIRDDQDELFGELEVAVSFNYLMGIVEQFGWWQSQKACIVDFSGRYLAHSAAMEEGRMQLGETGDPVELAVLEKMQEEHFGTYLGDGHPPEMISGFYRLEQAPWVLVMYAPGREVLAPVVNFRFYYTIAGGLSILLILLLIQGVAGQMVRRIRNISMASEKVAQEEYVDPLPVSSTDEIGQLETSFNAMVNGLRERDFIRDTFGRYMDRDIAVDLMKRPEASRLGGQKREVAILVSDIRSFTTISESLSPETTIRLLNNYFSHMIEVIQKHKGIIVDFYGDGILVFFDPHDGPIGPAVDLAIQCASEMRETMNGFNKELQTDNLPQLHTGIGIHAGEVIVGNIGSTTRTKYGIVGSAVNTTSRICEKAKGGEVIISKWACTLSERNLEIKRIFDVGLKGIQQEITLCLI